MASGMMSVSPHSCRADSWETIAPPNRGVYASVDRRSSVAGSASAIGVGPS